MTPPSADGVLHLTDTFEPGGLERVVVDLAAGLARAGRPVGVHAALGGAFWNELPAGVTRHPFPGTPGVLSLRRLLRSGRYGIVHAHKRKMALIAHVAAAGLGVRVVEHVHTVLPVTPVGRILSFRSPVLLACGSAVAEMIERDFGRSGEHIRLVPNGVHDPATGILPTLPSVRRPGTLRLVGVGRLVEQKDPLRFVRLVAALRLALPGTDVRATWVGDGPLRTAMQQQIERLGMADVVTLAGHRNDVHRFLAESDVLLLTSRWEGLPLVALEALAMGRGLVLPDVGSCTEAVGSGAVGLLYDAALPDQRLAQQIAAVLTPERLLDWSLAARLRFEVRFAFPRVLEQVLAAYDDALGRPARTTDALPRLAARIPG